jgi:hypothetical protein
MKKRSLIFSTVLVVLSIAVFGFSNWNQSATDKVETTSTLLALDEPVLYTVNEKVYPNFLYDVGTRFMMTITKEELNTARSIRDFITADMTEPVVSYKSVSIVIIENERQTDIRETGNSDVLTASQIKLLRSADYSTHFSVRADYQKKNMETGQLYDSYFNPHITIVPEKQAVYVHGKDALIAYLKENSREKTILAEEKKLQPGKLYFTVTKKGTISNVKLQSTSGYPSIDKTMLELITNLPGTWEPAENSKGEKVDQELVFSFGLMGC